MASKLYKSGVVKPQNTKRTPPITPARSTHVESSKQSHPPPSKIWYCWCETFRRGSAHGGPETPQRLDLGSSETPVSPRLRV
jgi:hypothetical protein